MALPTLPKRSRYIGIGVVLLGLICLGKAIDFVIKRHDGPSYFMIAASVMLILSGSFRIWRAQK